MAEPLHRSRDDRMLAGVAAGVAETLDWAAALVELDASALDPATVSDTLGVLLKYQDDIARIEGTKAKELIEEARAQMRAAE